MAVGAAGPDRVTAVYPVQRTRRVLTRLEQANVAADEAIAAYETRKAKLARMHPDAVVYRLRVRDDLELADLASTCTFHTTLATRLALTILAESAMRRDDV